jgi:hypothetical protein
MNESPKFLGYLPDTLGEMILNYKINPEDYEAALNK